MFPIIKNTWFKINIKQFKSDFCVKLISALETGVLLPNQKSVLKLKFFTRVKVLTKWVFLIETLV